MEISELKQSAKNSLRHTVAGLMYELPEPVNNAKVSIEIENRQARIRIEDQGVAVTEEELLSKLFRSIKAEVKEAGNPETVLKKPEPEEENEEGGGVKETILNG